MIEIQKPLKAYKEYPGPILLLAGPGTGKTYQLAMRIKYLIEELDAEPDEIAVITFTIEAARNMRERLTEEDIDLPKEHYPESTSKPKPTFSKKIIVNNKIQIWDVPSDNKEAEIIARIAKKNIATDSVTVIIPNLNYLPPIKKALKHAGLDYKYKFNINEEGLIRFSVLSNWAEDPNDNLIMRYFLDLTINNHDKLTKKIDTPTKKITEKRETASELIASLWGDVYKKQSLYDVICNVGEESEEDSYLAHLKDSLDDIHKLLKEKGSSCHQHHEFLGKTGLLLAPGKNPKGIISEIKEWMKQISNVFVKLRSEPGLEL